MKYALIPLMTVLLVACGPAPEEKKSQPSPENNPQKAAISVNVSEIKRIITQRCTTCHSATPSDEIFRAAPANVMFDSLEQIQQAAPRIYARSVATQTMPFMNKTAMTEEERSIIGEWIKAGAKIQ